MNHLVRNPIFGSVFDLSSSQSSFREELMKTDIYEREGIYYLEMDLPGFSKENIWINYDNGYVTVEAKMEESGVDKGEYIHKEKFYGEYKRSFYIGDVKEEEVKASYQDGVLYVVLPKRVEQPSTKRQITID